MYLPIWMKCNIMSSTPVSPSTYRHLLLMSYRHIVYHSILFLVLKIGCRFPGGSRYSWNQVVPDTVNIKWFPKQVYYYQLVPKTGLLISFGYRHRFFIIIWVMYGFRIKKRLRSEKTYKYWNFEFDFEREQFMYTAYYKNSNYYIKLFT